MEQRLWRTVMRRKYQITRNRVQLHNRLEALLEEAHIKWSDPDRLEIPARSLDEPRTQVIGRIGDAVWSAFITMPGDRIRIISVRRARDEEEAASLQD